MKVKTLISTVLISISTAMTIQAEETQISPDGTYLYTKRDTCELYMDVYDPAEGSQTCIDGKEKPTIVFMFGGGFIQGARDDESYNNWFRMLTQNGYRVISIDYRLGLKGSKKVGIAQVDVLDKAIHMAVEDLFSATVFLLDNAESLGIDPSNIVISGSSAGAISVMQAEYEVCNRTSWASVLPSDFNYAGVMSFSGAILSRNGKVTYAQEPCATLMLHGTDDDLVPYKQITFFKLGFFGGGKLVERFRKFGYNYNMYHFIDYGHEIAGSMENTLDMQMKFLESNVMQGRKRIIEARLSDSGIYKGAGPQSRKEIYK